VLCWRAFRSSVQSNVPPEAWHRRTAPETVTLPMLKAELVRRIGGRSQWARAVRASDLDGVLTLAPAALAALGPAWRWSRAITYWGDRTMRDPELAARAQHAAARLESAWERWRALQGLGETSAQPVVGYVGYALKEPWGQPRAVIGFSAEEAERLAEFLEHGTGDHDAINRSALEIGSGTPERSARSHRATDRSRELAQRSASEQLPDVLAVTSQLSGSQHRHSFL